MQMKIDHVSKNFGAKQALSNISFSLEPGVTGLLGPNGAGKSTLMKLIATIDVPSEGNLFYNGTDIVRHPNGIRRELGYLPQSFGIYPNMTPLEFLEYMAAMKSLNMKSAKKRINELLEILNLYDVRKRAVGGFSGGMRQRVGIAQALLNDPSVLIVDEPTVGLDPEERIQFRNLLSSMANDRIIILSTHIVTDIESIAPKIAILSQGILIACETPEQLIQKAEGKVWHCNVSVQQLKELQEKFVVSGSMQKSDGIHAWVISVKQPSLAAVPAAPSLEDAYLYATAYKEAV